MTGGEVTMEHPCMGGRKGRDGLFPASDCIKVTGYYGELMMMMMTASKSPATTVSS